METNFANSTPLMSIAIALSLGMLTLLICRKAKIVPIGPLLIVGIIFGPQGLSIFDPNLLKDHLQLIISLGVTIILFEGGLALDYSSYRKIGGVVSRLLSLGVVITWLVNGFAIYFLFNFSIAFSLFASSLIVVTGPTVISPLLRRVSINKKLYNILHWEGVLIDPIGVFLAILCFEIVISQGGEISVAVGHLLIQLLSGISVGLILGNITVYLLNRRSIPSELTNISVLTVAIMTYSICDFIAPESGLLGVVVAGMVIGIKKKIPIDDIKKFKLELTDIFLGFLFVVLAAGLDISQIKSFYKEGAILILIVLFITRPLSVFLCSLKSDLLLREKFFVSWIAPRGIIAASVATIFSLSLKNNPQLADKAWFVETFTFSVIIITVVFQGFSASLIAKWLKVSQKLQFWAIVGAHDFSEKLAHYLEKKGIKVILLDNNRNHIEIYRSRGVNTLYANSLSPDIFSTEALFGVSHVIALTDNSELNQLICIHWKKIISNENLFWWSEEEASLETAKGTIWHHLGKPSEISHGLAKGEYEIVEKNLNSDELSEGENILPLLQLSPKKILFQPPNKNDDEKKPWLVLKNNKIIEESSIVPQSLLFFEKEKSTIVFRRMLEMASKHCGFKLSKELYTFVEKKSEEQGICIGNHMAIISLPIEKLKKINIFFGEHKKGLDLNAYDKKKVRMLFLICYPTSMQTKYFSVISKISRIFSKEENLEIMENAKDAKEMNDVFIALDGD